MSGLTTFLSGLGDDDSSDTAELPVDEEAAEPRLIELRLEGLQVDDEPGLEDRRGEEARDLPLQGRLGIVGAQGLLQVGGIDVGDGEDRVARHAARSAPRRAGQSGAPLG